MVAFFVASAVVSGCQWFVEDFPAPATESSATDSGVEASPDVQDAAPLPESAVPEADAVAEHSETDVQPNCDRDGDGHDALGTCGGDDCDDDDAEVFPGQTRFFTVPNKRGNFDYDCDSQITWPEEFNKTVDCAGMGPVGCDINSKGFLGNLPKCGEAGSWGGCKVNGMSCDEHKNKEVILPCR